MIKIETPLTKEKLKKLKKGQLVYLTGTIYAARDRAHKRLVELIKTRKKLPIDLEGNIIYYCGPTFKKEKIGACGPTTSSRMDDFVQPLLKNGLCAMIGKGNRSNQVNLDCKKYKAVYFITYSGCGAYLNQFIKKTKQVAFKDLGAESIYKFEVENFPLIVAIDSLGKTIY